jgi:hypothetical protein
MVSSSTRFNRRTFSALGLGASVGLLAPSTGVFAQDASPAASPEVAEVGAFDNTGLAEVVITADQYTFATGVPGAMGEGWYILTLQNNSETVASLNLGLLPEGTTGGDLSGLLSQSFKGEGGELPEWWTSATFAGGNVAAAGESTSTLVYLTPGQWYMFSTNPAAMQSPSSFKVLTPEELETNYGIAAPEGEATPMASPDVAGAAAPEGVVATVRVQLTDSAVQPDGAPAGGQQVLQVINAGEQVHDFIILHTDDVLDEAGAASLATSWIRGEETNATSVGGVGTLSPGNTAFSAVDVQPGTYAAFSSLPDANGGLQVDSGLVAVFTAQ